MNDIENMNALVDAYRRIWSQQEVSGAGGINLMPFAWPNEIWQVTIESGEQDGTVLLTFTQLGKPASDAVALSLAGAEQMGCLLLGYVLAARALASTAPHCSN
jgi:hypothetical protein